MSLKIRFVDFAPTPTALRQLTKKQRRRLSKREHAKLRKIQSVEGEQRGD